MPPVLPIAQISQQYVGATEWEALKSSSDTKNIFSATSFASGYAELKDRFLSTQVALIPLSEVTHEVWRVDNMEVQVDHNREATVATAGDVSFIAITVPEAATAGDHTSPLAAAGYQAYQQLFQLIKQADLGTMVRVWNYVPRILKMTNDQIPAEDRERYRQFNAGRADAWADFGPRKGQQLLRPSATGIGSRGGPLVLQCLTSRHPVHYLENPRQIPAYNYPAKYGTKAPAFARGSLHLVPDRPELYIAGTASIVGSETTNLNYPAAQVEETFANISSLIGAQNLKTYEHGGFDLDDLTNIRVYIKNPDQYELIRQKVEAVLGNDRSIIYLNDDICRPDLLLEIEAIARKN